jgi:subtilase family serine protease
MSYRRLGLSVFAAVLTVAATNVGTQASSDRSTLTGNVPAWATSANFKSPADTTDSIGFRIYLGWNNEGALQSFISSVSDPQSASYGLYLTPAQFRQQYAPKQQQALAIQDWLRSQGFTIDYTPQNNHYIAAEGSVAQAAAAFGVTFGMYSVDGMTLRSPSADPSMPADLSAGVSGIVGLDESAALVEPDSTGGEDPGAPPSPAFVSATPCSTYWNQSPATGFLNPYGAAQLSYTPCGYTPQQVRGAYQAPGNLFGDGQTVAIVDAYASPTIVHDADQWSCNRGISPFFNNDPCASAPKTGSFVQVIAPGTMKRPQVVNHKRIVQDPQGWYGEETLDVESVHGMAPDANIVFVGTPNNYRDLDAGLNHVVDFRLAHIVTNSYGFPTEALPHGFINAVEGTIEQGAAEGIGIYFSSGDFSDNSIITGFPTPNWPASSPLVTAVGGTSLAVGAANNYLFETGWGTRTDTYTTPTTLAVTPPGRFQSGAGGGVSCLFGRPGYQAASEALTAPATSLCPGFLGRAVPDVAGVADPNTGYLVGQTQTFPDGTVKYSEYRLGGTSLASPIFAGLMALKDESSGFFHGFANPLFYGHPAVFNDITDPSAANSVGTLNGHPVVATVRTNYANGVDATAGRLFVLRTFNQCRGLKTTPGYDDVTGVGSPAATFWTSLQ